jgi:hypothetical protein
MPMISLMMYMLSFVLFMTWLQPIKMLKYMLKEPKKQSKQKSKHRRSHSVPSTQGQ